jgi:hypothetical protein
MFIYDRPIAQGELEIFAVTPDHFDGQECSPMDATGPHFILAHSESGHHHVLDRAAAEVFTVPNSQGMEMLRMIVREPTKVRNLGGSGHKDLALGVGEYLVVKSREMTLDDVIRTSAD